MILEIPIEEVLQLRQQVLWPNKDLDFVRIPNDDIGIHFGIFQEGQWISCISLFIQEPHSAVFRKLATLPNFQNKGYGSQLLHYSFNYLQQRGVHSISCSARKEKQEFYFKLGMHAIGNPYCKNGLDYIQMVLTIK